MKKTTLCSTCAKGLVRERDCEDSDCKTRHITVKCLEGNDYPEQPITSCNEFTQDRVKKTTYHDPDFAEYEKKMTMNAETSHLAKPGTLLDSDLKEWFKEIIRYGARPELYIQNVDDPVEKKHKVKYRLFTQDHIYSILAVERQDGGYLGCIVSTRKPRAGEDWSVRPYTDLADGPLCYATWVRIKNDIIGYELQKLQEIYFQK